LNNLGGLLKEKRETKGVSISEASNDLKIKEVVLENIEEGNIGAFKDIYVLKEQIRNYAKYLGLNHESIVDEFNEYLFEYTSKIPIKEIEKEISKQNNKIEKDELKVSSPYTKPMKKYPKSYYFLIYAIIILLVFIVFIWSIRQITIKTRETNAISYMK
jgi:cytoskeletal protein RodZ